MSFIGTDLAIILLDGVEMGILLSENLLLLMVLEVV
jgi:hypothetical protein